MNSGIHRKARMCRLPKGRRDDPYRHAEDVVLSCDAPNHIGGSKFATQ